jgi:hypothetical protein
MSDWSATGRIDNQKGLRKKVLQNRTLCFELCVFTHTFDLPSRGHGNVARAVHSWSLLRRVHSRSSSEKHTIDTRATSIRVQPTIPESRPA